MYGNGWERKTKNCFLTWKYLIVKKNPYRKSGFTGGLFRIVSICCNGWARFGRTDGQGAPIEAAAKCFILQQPLQLVEKVRSTPAIYAKLSKSGENHSLFSTFDA